MPIFTPPTVNDVPRLLREPPPFGSGPPGERLFSHYSPLPRGRTVILLTNGTVALVDMPVQTVNDSDPFVEAGLAGIPYSSIRRVYMGGHIHDIDAEEVTLLTAAGYAANIS